VLIVNHKCCRNNPMDELITVFACS
jgi:hypothetical protein